MNFEEMSEQEILSIANPIMNNLMQAPTDIDHEHTFVILPIAQRELLPGIVCKEPAKYIRKKKASGYIESQWQYSGVPIRPLSSGSSIAPGPKANTLPR